MHVIAPVLCVCVWGGVSRLPAGTLFVRSFLMDGLLISDWCWQSDVLSDRHRQVRRTRRCSRRSRPTTTRSESRLGIGSLIRGSVRITPTQYFRTHLCQFHWGGDALLPLINLCPPPLPPRKRRRRRRSPKDHVELGAGQTRGADNLTNRCILYTVHNHRSFARHG